MHLAPKIASGNVHDQLNKSGIMEVPDCWTVRADQLGCQLGLSNMPPCPKFHLGNQG